MSRDVASRRTTYLDYMSDRTNEFLAKFYPHFLVRQLSVWQKLAILEANFKNENDPKNEDDLKNKKNKKVKMTLKITRRTIGAKDYKLLQDKLQDQKILQVISMLTFLHTHTCMHA